jgi:hypothetical protein
MDNRRFNFDYLSKSAQTIVLLSASIISLAALVAIEKGSKQPLVPLHIFWNTPNLLLYNIVMALMGAAWVPDALNNGFHMAFTGAAFGSAVAAIVSLKCVKEKEWKEKTSAVYLRIAAST